MVFEEWPPLEEKQDGAIGEDTGWQQDSVVLVDFKQQIVGEQDPTTTQATSQDGQETVEVEEVIVEAEDRPVEVEEVTDEDGLESLLHVEPTRPEGLVEEEGDLEKEGESAVDREPSPEGAGVELAGDGLAAVVD